LTWAVKAVGKKSRRAPAFSDGANLSSGFEMPG
jgi:hypothetical protein